MRLWADLDDVDDDVAGVQAYSFPRDGRETLGIRRDMAVALSKGQHDLGRGRRSRAVAGKHALVIHADSATAANARSIAIGGGSGRAAWHDRGPSCALQPQRALTHSRSTSCCCNYFCSLPVSEGLAWIMSHMSHRTDHHGFIRS